MYFRRLKFSETNKVLIGILESSTSNNGEIGVSKTTYDALDDIIVDDYYYF
jgi:hypothetical protein